MLLARDIMRVKPVTFAPTDTIKKALMVFTRQNTCSAPVVTADGKPVGLVTGDLLLQAVFSESLANGSGKTINETLDKVMSTDLTFVSPDMPVRKIHQMDPPLLVVVDSERVLLGVITVSDLVTGFTKELNNVLDRFNTIVESVHNGVLAIDEQGYIRIYNKTAEQLLGQPQEVVLGKHILEAIPDTALLKVLQSGKPQYNQKMQLKNGTVLTNCTPVIKEQRIVGAVAVLQDISALEAASQELSVVKQLNKELDAIIDAVYDGLYIADGRGYTTRINKSYERITGIKAEEVIGRHMQELVNEKIYSESVTLRILREKRRTPLTIIHTVKGKKQLLVTGNPVLNEQGNIISVVTTVRDISELVHLKDELEKSHRLAKRYQLGLEELKRHHDRPSGLVYQCKAMQQVVSVAQKVAQVDANVLLLGETGVGKELLAKEIHLSGPRADGPFITVNCAAIPETLLESELFGYEKGAFTGADQRGKPGMFELANNGTILLDEIGDLPLPLQTKLLRVLQEKTVTRIGGTCPITLNIRIIAAANNDLEEQVSKGSFREDLFYRLNVLPIYIPPLRQRVDDIPLLIRHFLQTFNNLYGKKVSLNLSTYRRLLDYDWPGNVRELRNAIERIVIMSDEDQVSAHHLDDLIFEKTNHLPCLPTQTNNLYEAVAQYEKELLQQALAKHGSTYKVAKALGISQPTVVRKIQKHRIQSNWQ